ncbi:MAG: polyprenyl synthetase family protein [Planctomycetes bacterium]|nr:polyprenyl synthetase family protein [Planctomycetota bacterium]
MPDLALPAKVPQQAYRPAQSNIPNERPVRDRIKQLVKDHVATRNLVPPMPMAELREHAVPIREAAGVLEIHDEYIAVLINNESWRDTLAQVPYERRLLLLPKCLRVEEHCPAPFDEFGLLCKECGLCSIQEFTAEADRLGYAVLVAEGSAIVRSMIETGKIDAIVGVSCLNVLEKSFPHMEAAAVPGVAIPLLQDDCINCTVDLDWVWDVIHLTSEDQTYRLDLDALKDEVKSWFTAEALDALMGTPSDPTALIAHDWMARSGNRWRPYLATCVNVALECDGKTNEPSFSDDLKRLAVAIECFHKASLIHDDIEDGDQQRYGEPTLHAEHGEPVAINVGDFLVGEGYRLISELSDVVPPATKVEMLRLAATGHVTLSRGQGRELIWAQNPEPLSAKDVLKIFREKTAPAFDVALRLGALFAGTDGQVHDALTEYSESIGIAYQIKDDMEDFTDGGDSHDLRDLRPSLLLAIASKRAKGDEERDLVEALWKKETRYEDVQDEIDHLLRERGVVDKASELKGAYEEQAVRALRFLENATLKGLLRRVVGKIFPRTLIEGYCSEFEARNAPGGEAGASSSG